MTNWMLRGLVFGAAMVVVRLFQGTLIQAMQSIKAELRGRLQQLNEQGRLLEAQRLEQRTTFDLEMMEATGSCAGIENYSQIGRAHV